MFPPYFPVLIWLGELVLLPEIVIGPPNVDVIPD